MNKNSLRSLGIGFLASAILTGTFATFVQGNSPMNKSFSDLMKPGVINNQEADKASLEDRLTSLESERTALQAEVSSLKEANESQDKLLKEKQEKTTSSEQESSSERETTSENEHEGLFVIEEGMSAQEISEALEAEGYIQDAAEFQALIDEWGLSTFIAAGDYELNSDMSIHDIASLITQGAYYYY